MKRTFGIFSEITKKGFISISYLGRNIIIHIKQSQLNYDFISKLIETEEFQNYDEKFKKKYENNDLTVLMIYF
jgi:hypothetical protein